MFKKIARFFSRTHERPAAVQNGLLENLYEQLYKSYPGKKFRLSHYEITTEQGLVIKARVLDSITYPNSMIYHLSFTVYHSVYFPDAIQEQLAGIGKDERSALMSGILSFLSGLYPVVTGSLEGETEPFELIVNNKVWHPVISSLQVQGTFSRQQETLKHENIYKLLEPLLFSKITASDQLFHWVKVYISKQPGGEIIGDCYFNNQPWDEGLTVLKKYADTWNTGGQFAGQKQFIILRKCLDHDH